MEKWMKNCLGVKIWEQKICNLKKRVIFWTRFIDPHACMQSSAVHIVTPMQELGVVSCEDISCHVRPTALILQSFWWWFQKVYLAQPLLFSTAGSSSLLDIYVEIFLQTKNLSLGHQDPSFLCQVCCCLQTRHFPHDSLAIFLASLTQSSVLATAPVLNRQVQHLSFSTPLYKLTAKPAPD